MGGHARGAQVREHRAERRHAEEERDERRGDAPGGKAAAGHIVAGQVIVGAKVKRRAKARGVIPHQPGRHQHKRQRKGQRLPRPGAAAQAFFGHAALPEDGQRQYGEQFHLRAAAGHQRHAHTAQRQVRQQRRAALYRRVGRRQPLPQPRHGQRHAAEDGVLIGRRAQQQVKHLAARGDAGARQQVGRRAGAREPPAQRLLDAAKRSQDQQPAQRDHRQTGRQVGHAGQCLERELEQQAGHHAKVDIVPPLVVGDVPQRVGRGGLAGGGVVGVCHLLHGGGRVLYQVQPPLQQAVRQRAVLGGGVAGGFVDVLGERQTADAVPVGGVIKRRRHAGVETVGKRRAEHKPRQHGHDQRHRRAVTARVLKVGVPPQRARRAQRERRPQQREQRRAPHEREVQRARHVGPDRLQRIAERVLPVLALVGGGRQRQRRRLAREIEAAHQAAGAAHRHLPRPALTRDTAGLVGGGHRQRKQRVLDFGVGAVVLVGQAVQPQVVQFLVKPGKGQRRVFPVQRQRRVGVGVLRQVGAQVHRRVAVGGPEIEVAHKHFQPQCGGQQHPGRRQAAPARQPPVQPQPQHDGAAPQHHAGDAQQAEGVKPGRKARFLVDARGPDPDAQHDARPGPQVGTGNAAAAQPPRQPGRQRRDEQRKQNGNDEHSNAPLFWLVRRQAAGWIIRPGAARCRFFRPWRG